MERERLRLLEAEFGVGRQGLDALDQQLRFAHVAHLEDELDGITRLGGFKKRCEILVALGAAGDIGLAQQGRLVILRKGKPADPADFKGVYRLRIAAQTDQTDPA